MIYLLNQGPLSEGWWLIPVLFGIVLPAILIYNGYTKAQKGTFQRVPDPQPGNPNATRLVRNTDPQPWHKHNLSRMGLVLAGIILIITAIRLITFE